MSWLLFYLLAALFPVAFIVIGFKSKTWLARLLYWALLTLPVFWYCWDYFAIKREHERLCAAEGGLRVLIQPEKVDRVRLDESFMALSARSMLEVYYPRLQIVESKPGERRGTGNVTQHYVSYTAEPNPRVGLPMDKGPWSKEPKLTYQESRVESPAANVFDISVHETSISHGTSKETRLSKGGKAYAKYSEFVHWWTGIQYPDALPTWRCPKSPPRGEPNSPPEKWVYPPYAEDALMELILK